MAFVEVKVDENELSGGDFFKFDALGTKLTARFVSFVAKKGNFEKLEQHYTFRTKAGDVVVNAPTHLARTLEKAALKPGHAVMMEYVRDLPPTREGYSPMKIFKVLVDSAPPKPGAAKPPPPPPVPEADPLDDIPY